MFTIFVIAISLLKLYPKEIHGQEHIYAHTNLFIIPLYDMKIQKQPEYQ